MAWLSLDERDEEMARFWRYVAAALQLAVTVGEAMGLAGVSE